MGVKGFPYVGYRLLDLRMTRGGVAIFFTYILLVGVCGSWLIGSSMVAVALTACILVIAIIAPERTCWELLFVCFPFFNVMGQELGGTSLYYILILVALAKGIKAGSLDHLRYRLLFLLAVILLTIYNAGAGQLYVRWLLHLLVPILLIGSDRMRKFFPRYVGFVTLSMVLSSAVGLLMLQSGVYLYTGGQVWTSGDLTTRYAGLVGDSVFFAQVSSVVIGANAFLVYRERSYPLAVPLTCLQGFFSLLAYSKSGILCLAVAVTFIVGAFIVKTVRRGFPLRSLLAFLAVIVATWFAFRWIAFGSSLFNLGALNTRLSAADPLTGRGEIWQGYFNLWQKEGSQLIFRGIGFDVYSTTFVWQSINKCHNLYIESVTLFGYLQAILIFVLLDVHFFRCAITGVGLMAFLPCIVLLMSGVVLHGFTDNPFFYEWTIALGCLDYAVGISEGLNTHKQMQGRIHVSKR